MDLCRRVEEELGLEEGTISGTWDFAHNLQIIWKTGLAQHPLVEEIISLVFETMDDYRLGKSSTIFRARAAELGHLVLTNKKQQTTRFVRSLARGLQAWFRNLPTIIAIKSMVYEEAVRDCKNTTALEVLKHLNKIRDPRNTLLSLGLAQVLELYCKASLQAQHNFRFLSQAWAVVKNMRERLESLAQEWKWSTEELEFAGTEAPAAIVQRIKETGMYRPVVPLKCVQRSTILKETGLLSGGQKKIKDLFDEEGESVIPLAGEAMMEVPRLWRARRGGRGLYVGGDGAGGDDGGGGDGHDGRSGGTRRFTDDDERILKEELESLCRDILESWNERQQQTNLEKAAFAAFGEKFDWDGEDYRKVSQEGVAAVVSVRSTVKMQTLLSALLEELPEEMAAERFNVDEILCGYSSFLKYWTKESDSMEQEDHEMYRAWYKVHYIVTFTLHT